MDDQFDGPRHALDMGDETMTIPEDDPTRIELLLAVRGGLVDTIRQLLAEHPGLATARLVGRKNGTSTPLHLVTDWPGYFPNGPEIVRLLVEAGGDPNAATTGGGQPETPLHYAASSDDSEVAAALIDAGAHLDTPGGSIGTPLANAIGYGCWNVARLLVARGAAIDELWQAAALGDRHRVAELMQAEPPPTSEDVDEAFWQACHGGQRRMAEHLLALGANINATTGYGGEQTALEVAGDVDTQRQALIEWLDERRTPSA